MKQYKIGISELLEDGKCWNAFVNDMKSGAVAALPTDTIYGFAADAESFDGVRALYAAKGREENKPLILFLPDVVDLSRIGIFPDNRVERLLKKMWPGGFTAVFKLEGQPLPAFEFSTIGIRVPNHADLLRLLRKYPGFLLTTSANKSGYPPLSDADTIAAEFRSSIQWVLDGGHLAESTPSTVADVSVWPPLVLRQGTTKLDFV